MDLIKIHNVYNNNKKESTAYIKNKIELLKWMVCKLVRKRSSKKNEIIFPFHAR